MRLCLNISLDILLNNINIFKLQHISNLIRLILIMRKIITKSQGLFRLSKYNCSKQKNLQEFEDPQTIIQHQMQKRTQNLERRYRDLQTIVDQKINLPYKLYGTQDRYEAKFSYIPDRVMSFYRIHSSTITDFLLKVYKGSLYAIADKNQSFMNQYWENGFKEKTLKGLSQLQQDKYTLKVINDQNFLSQVGQSCQILDSVMVRGLSADRSQNMHPSQYRKSTEHDDVGLLVYTPNYLTQMNERFINPQSNKNVYKGFDQMVLRVLLRIRTPLRLTVDQIEIQKQIYTWEHLCIMENTMVPPPQFKSDYKVQTYMEWLGKYRFGLWKMADMDNFMLGNSFFRQKVVQEPMDPIFKGSKFDKTSFIDIRQF